MDNILDIQVQNLHITQNILTLVAEIDEFKGAWRALGQLAPERLNALKKIATIESVGSSTRIGSGRLEDEEVRELLSGWGSRDGRGGDRDGQSVQGGGRDERDGPSSGDGRGEPAQVLSTRNQQEVVGYAEVMELVYRNYGTIQLSESYIQQLHALLLQYSEEDAWHRGSYKKSPNHIEGFGPDGKSLGVVVETAEPSETAVNMEKLLEWTNEAFAGKKLHPLLMSSIFVAEFLAIHPFQHGNGRLSRILTTLLHLKNNYIYVPYSALESVIEQSKEGYFLSLRQTQRTLRSDNPNWQPWVLFFIRALHRQKQRLEAEIELEKSLLGELPELSMKILELIRSKGRATVRDVVAITHANRNTIKKHLEAMVDKHYLQQNGMGKGTWYSGR